MCGIAPREWSGEGCPPARGRDPPRSGVRRFRPRGECAALRLASGLGRVARPHEVGILPGSVSIGSALGVNVRHCASRVVRGGLPAHTRQQPSPNPYPGRRTVRELRLISLRRVESWIRVTSKRFPATPMSTSRRIPVRRPRAASAAAPGGRSCSRRAAFPPDDNLKRYRLTSSPGRIARPTSQRSSPNQRQVPSPTTH